jgi:integrase
MLIKEPTDIAHFGKRWRPMIEYALTNKQWAAEGKWYYAQQLEHQVLGISATGFIARAPNHAVLIGGIRDLYKAWAETRLPSDQDNMAGFCGFLSSDAGRVLRMDGLQWIAAVMRAPETGNGTGIQRPMHSWGYPPWSDDDMAKFEARWPRGTRERVIFDILAYTGLRIGDVATLGRQHLKQRTIVINGQALRRTAISIDNEKTGMRVELPLLPQLKETLDAGPTGDLAFIVTRRGTPWNKGALGTEFVAAARAAGVVGKSAHGMRKAAATRAAENGATERELEAIFGWSGGRMATLYTKSANRGRLAAGAIGKLDRAETENRTSIPVPSAEVRAGNRKSE